MGLSLAEQYYLRAVEEYPYDLEEVFRNIDLTLIQDKRHAGALCLLARLYHEELRDFEKADQQFRRALNANPRRAETYEYFIEFLLCMEEADEAELFLRNARQLRGIQKSRLHYWQATIWEIRNRLDLAMSELKLALSKAYQKWPYDFLEGQIERLEKKLDQDKQSLYIWK
ncbi:MAG: hypothetical protein GC180_07880 [Bacteroidetes bacterium]|nr:hypothetical protein [Bacteroidota bacterium]